MWYVYDKKRGDRLFPVFFETDKCVGIREVEKEKEVNGDDDDAKNVIDDEEEKKSVSTTVCCLCMKDNDFSSHIFVSIIFLHSPKLAPCMFMCLCVLAAMRCRTRSTNKRHIYIYMEKGERITASFVVHHVERILFLSFFSRFLVLLLMLMRFLSLSLPQTYHQAMTTAQH